MSLRVLMNGRFLRLEHVTTDRQQGRSGMLTVRHRHPVFHLMYVTDGEGRFLVNERVTRAVPGLLYIINPDEWHQFHGDERNPLHNLNAPYLSETEEQPYCPIFLIGSRRSAAFPCRGCFARSPSPSPRSSVRGCWKNSIGCWIPPTASLRRSIDPSWRWTCCCARKSCCGS